MDATLVTSAAAEVEVGRALRRRSAPASIHKSAQQLLERCDVVDLTADIRSRAIDVRPSSVRALDAIHVATAIVAGLQDFASFDLRQRVAAEEMGLRLVPAGAA